MKKVVMLFAMIVGMMSMSNQGHAKIERRSTIYDYSNNERELSVSYKGTKNAREFLRAGMVPVGSAALSMSGDLASTGIKGIIHAASGSMTRKDGIYSPSIEGVQKSIMNSMLLARHHRYKTIAIPFIGSGIFLNSIGVSKEELAAVIMTTALRYSGAMKVSFIAYSDSDKIVFDKVLPQAISDYSKFKNFTNKVFGKDDIKDRAVVLQGSIADYNLHKSEIIVNAANSELLFGGGLSGFIARKTGRSSDIDRQFNAMIKQMEYA